MTTLSIVLTTRNRDVKLRDCINSILRNTWSDYEIILVDQNKTSNPSAYKNPKIKYIHSGPMGKSRAINTGAVQSSGNILVFTDDDCVVSKNWLKQVAASFFRNDSLCAVFGKTLPMPHKNNNGLICPSVFTNNRSRYITKPCLHYKYIGFGNNMAIKKDTFLKSDGFKKWLGPGSVGCAAEDAEIALRVLINHHTVYYNPRMVAYHNKWLDKKEAEIQQFLYTCGELACYGYFAFQGYAFARPTVKRNINTMYQNVRFAIKSLLPHRRNAMTTRSIQSALLEVIFQIRGLFIGFVYSRIDPVRQ